MTRRGRIAAALATSALLATPPLRADTASDGLRALATAANREGRLVRIGLDPSRRVTIGADGAFRVVDPVSREPVWKEEFRKEITVVADGGPGEEAAPLFRIQVASFTERRLAEAERERLEATFGEPTRVRYVPDRGAWRVRIGEASDRAALGPLLERLRVAGLQGLWIAEEPATEITGVTLRIVDADWESFASGVSRLAVIPSAGASLTVQGKPYRGIVEIRVDDRGRVRPINWVELESYLLGVVPAELGPEVWPQLEALKAQAVAARTYVIANRDQFAEEGFDICATPRCQVYGGREAEHPLSNRAVLGTRGEVLTWEGRPITALYTATCGGHTENASEVFPDQKAPYLMGVPCRDEGAGRSPFSVAGKPFPALLTETGEDVTREAALLVAAGIVRSPHSEAGWREPMAPPDLRAWTSELARAAGRPLPSAPAGPTARLADAAFSIVSDLGLVERSRVLLAEEDLAALTRDPEVDPLPDGQRRALALLVSLGALKPGGEGRLDVLRAPSRGRVAAALARIGEIYDAFSFREGSVVGVRSGSIRLFEGRGEIVLPLGDAPALFASVGERSVPTERLDLWPGDRVRLRSGPDGRVDFIEMRPPVKGTSDDRSATVYAWEVRKSRAELEASVNARIAVGELQNLVVRRRGVSGRIVALEVVGSRGSSVVRGFDVRDLLGLRETLTVVEIQRDPSGRIDAVVFAGKGWGHGVGLCQVGAYGMAMRGVDYRGILAHYYRGAKVEAIDR